MAEATFVLRAEGVGKRFGRLQVLKAASLWAEAGKVTTIMGRNGSGKTTLMKVAVGALRADHGTVSYRGTAYARPSLAAFARQGLMYIPQEEIVSPNYRVRDHVNAIVATFGPDHVAAAIERCVIGDLLDQRAHELSRGERVRVSLALAYARRPEVLVIDEPLTGLAPVDQELLGTSLRELAAEGAAVVMSGHDTRVLLDLSDAVVWSVAGTTHHLGTSADALRHAQFRHEYLGPSFEEAEA